MTLVTVFVPGKKGITRENSWQRRHADRMWAMFKCRGWRCAVFPRGLSLAVLIAGAKERVFLYYFFLWNYFVASIMAWYAHASKRARMQSCIPMHTQADIREYKKRGLMHVRAYVCTYACTRICVYMHTCIHTHTRTNALTHTHNEQNPSFSLGLIISC